MATKGGSGGGEKSVDDLTFVGIIVLGLAVGAFLVWMAARDKITMFYVYARRVQLVLVDALGALGVPGAASVHEWFQKALKDPDGEYADYFYFRKGKNGNPPSNYRSYFGGSCWEKVPGTDKYYLHMFAKEQPDLNWENEKLRQKLYEMINWWLDKGLSGFRIDAISI